MFQFRGFPVLAHVLRHRDVALITEEVLDNCLLAIDAVFDNRPLWASALRFLVCDRRLWCGTAWRVKLKVGCAAACWVGVRANGLRSFSAGCPCPRAPQWLHTLGAIVRDHCTLFRMHSVMGVQGVLDTLRDLLEFLPTSGTDDTEAADGVGRLADHAPDVGSALSPVSAVTASAPEAIPPLTVRPPR